MSQIFDAIAKRRNLGRDFLCPRYENLVSPQSLPDIKPALTRIAAAAHQAQPILIYGDYDVDGVTASAAMHDTLRLAGAQHIDIMLPNRFTDGYGMSQKCVQRAQAIGAKLVITVDCGSRNHEIISQLVAAGIDVIVTDHHECEDDLPPALAVINPKRHDAEDASMLHCLAGVGVVFKLAQALAQQGIIPAGQEKWLLDLVLLGTICDSMPLNTENHNLCYWGLKVLAKTRRPGLKELLKIAGVTRPTGEAIGYQLGPRLNAAGRMDSAEKSLQLLLAKNHAEAAKLALELEGLNDQRRNQQNAAVNEIQAAGVDDDPVIVVKGDWHEGVLGIIAGRLVEDYRRPAFVLAAATDNTLKGSGRSFGDFSLAGALQACGDIIIGGGGHAEACGVRLAADKLPAFKSKINQYYRDLHLTNQERFLKLSADLEISDFSELNLELIAELRQLEPYGQGNETPIFQLKNARVVEVAHLGSDGQHLLLHVWDQNQHPLKLIGFFAPDNWPKLRGGEEVDILITIEENEFRGTRSVEGRILDILA